ncbi:MAG: AAA family ATPase, partial [Candidatus Eremiobacteraeota bacterium]|nr:AAA family ATPase [Candidatus Eremiobacteraeota bacterium]
MLQRLEIEDFGLIARAVLAFSGGLTVCSGETGSGKTMLLGALAFALGERSSPDVVRAGAERARVTLELEPDDALRASLAADGFELDEGEPAILSREMNAAGKSVARLNGRAATAAQLRAVGEAVLDFAGQHEHQRLLSHAYQLHLLDRFAGDDVENARADVARLHARTGALERELAGLRERSGRALAEAEFARFAVNEIDQAALEPGEDDRVRARRDYLANAERIAAALAQARHALISGEGAAVEALGAAGAALSAIGRYSEAIARLAETLGALQSDTNEAAAEISRELDRSELDPRELETLAGRLDAIERLKKKYGGTIDAVLAERATLAAALERLENRDAVELDLAAELASVRSQASERARTLTALRRAAARNLETAVAS